MTRVLVFDTETTGFPRSAPLADPLQPWLVELSWMLFDGPRCVEAVSHIVSLPDHVVIPENTTEIHGVTTEMATRNGRPLFALLSAFAEAAAFADRLVAHNIDFDVKIIEIAAARANADGLMRRLVEMRHQDLLVCTKAANVEAVGARFADGRRGKWPTLAETHHYYFAAEHDAQHSALGDVMACARIFMEMERRKAEADATERRRVEAIERDREREAEAVAQPADGDGVA